MKKVAINILSLLLFIRPANAQSIEGGAVYFKAGYTNLTGAGVVLNKLAPQGIPPIDDHFISLGFEGSYRHNRSLIFLNAAIGTQQIRQTVNKSGEAFAAGSFVNFGWIVRERKLFYIYPSLAAGFNALTLTTYNKETEEANADRHFYLLNPSIGVGINSDIVIKKVLTGKSYGSTLVGIRTGYSVSCKSNNWHSSTGTKIINMPRYGVHGFYISATIGIGAFIIKH